MPHDEQLATDYFEIACAKAYPPGCDEAGKRFAEGLGARKNEATSIRYFERACGLGSSEGCGERGLRMLRAAANEEQIREAERVLDGACRQGSTKACLALGEHLSTPLVDRSRPRASADAFSAACRFGSPVGCRRLGQAEACGRGVDFDPNDALELWASACDGGDVTACLELLNFIEVERLSREQASAYSLSGPMRSALRHRALATNELGMVKDAFHAIEVLELGDSSDAFAAIFRVCAALDDDDLDAAQKRLEGPVPELERTVLRGVLAERRRGTPWPDALYLGWGRAGMPDLSGSTALSSAPNDGVMDFLWCSAEDLEVRLDEDDAFLREFVGRFQDRRVERRQTQAHLIEAALQRLDSSDEVVQLVALAILRYSGLPGHRHEHDVRAALARAHPKSLYFQLLPMVSRDATPRAPTALELQRLEDVASLQFAPPSRAIYERLSRAVQAMGDAEAGYQTFRATVDASLGAMDFGDLRMWLERGARDSPRVVALEKRLGARIVEGGWLVHAYQGSFLLAAAQIHLRDDDTTKLEESVKKRADPVRFKNAIEGPVGRWPLRSARRAYELELIVDELGTIERLTALSMKAGGK